MRQFSLNTRTILILISLILFSGWGIFSRQSENPEVLSGSSDRRLPSVTSSPIFERSGTTIYPTNPMTEPSASVGGLPASGVEVVVVHVVDGDTVKLGNGQTLRYIGIDTTETVHPEKPVQCMGREATARNRELVEGKTVALEKDVSETDRYGRLLRYVWLDGVMVNELLVREGLAYSSSYPPDVRYQDRFRTAENEAREEGRGLWSGMCEGETGGSDVILQPTPVNETKNNQTYTCDCSRSCSAMSSCREAQHQLDVCGCSARDGDGDGIACDSDCQ